MLLVALVAVLLGGILGVMEADRRAARFHAEAEYHRRLAESYASKAFTLESAAGDDSPYTGVARVLVGAGLWTPEQQQEMEAEAIPLPPSPRRTELLAEARRIAREQAEYDRRLSEYHALQRRRCESSAFSPWFPAETDPESP